MHQEDFDSPIPWFESRRPSQFSMRNQRIAIGTDRTYRNRQRIPDAQGPAHSVLPPFFTKTRCEPAGAWAGKVIESAFYARFQLDYIADSYMMNFISQALKPPGAIRVR